MDDQLTLTIHDGHADAQRLDELSASLRRELLELDVERVDQVHEPAPPGTRAVDVAAVGVLLVVVKESAQAIAGVVALVKSWLTSGPSSRSVELTVGDHTLKVSGASVDQQDRLIAEFVASLQRTAEPTSNPSS